MRIHYINICNYSKSLHYLLSSPHLQPHLLDLLQGLAALQVFGDRHLLAVDGEAADVGRECLLNLVPTLDEVTDELADAKPVPGGHGGLAVQHDVLGRQPDVGSVRCGTHLGVTN